MVEMLVLGLIHDSGWEPGGREPPEDPPERRPRRSSRLPWRPLAWLAAWCWLMALVPVASDEFGPLAGFAVLMAAVALARMPRYRGLGAAVVALVAALLPLATAQADVLVAPQVYVRQLSSFNDQP